MSELPRLLFCCFDVVPGPSATSRRLTEYIRGLSERFQVVVLSVKTPDHPHIERYHGARLLRVPVGSGDLPSRAQTFDRAVRRQLESEDYGLVHFFDPFAGYALCEQRGELGYRLVYDACAFPSVELPLESPALAANRRFIARVRRQELYCLMNADGVVVGSPLTADYVAALGVDRSQLRVLRAPVDLTPFTPEAMGRPDATPMRVMHVGRATRGQGLELLLEALHVALQTVDVRLTVVGPRSPEAHGRLEALVAELKLAGKVDFQGPVPHGEIHKLLATADVGALTLDEVERNQAVGPPLARLGEYLAAGRPVIAADVPGARALAPREGAVWYRPGDARSLADALVRLGSDPAARVKLGAAARAAATEWGSERVRLELVRLYAEVTGALAPEPAEAPVDSFEPTQLGRATAEAEVGEFTQLGDAGGPAAESVAGKVETDPAIAPRADSTPGAPAARAGESDVPWRQAPEGVALTEASAPAPQPAPSRPWATFDDEERTDLRAQVEVAPAEPEARERPISSSPSGLTVPPSPGASVPAAPAAAPPLGASSSSPSGLTAPPPLKSASSPSGLTKPPPLKSASSPSALTPAPPLGPSSSSPSGLTKPPPLKSASSASGLTPAPPLGLSPSSPSGLMRAAADASKGPPPLPSRRITSTLPAVGSPPAEPSPVASGPSSAGGLLPSAPGAPVGTRPEEDVAELDAGEVLEVDETRAQAAQDEAEGEEAFMESDEAVEPVETDPSPPPSALDPWLAQLVHGYCPPESHLFDRPPPPTTTPGLDT